MNNVRDGFVALEKAGLLKHDTSGRLVKSHSYIDFRSGNYKENIRSFHSQLLDRAKEMLKKEISEEDLEKRPITSLILTAPRSKITWAKQKLTDFLDDLAIELSEGVPEEVFQLSLQFIPLSSQNRGSKKNS